MFYVKEKINEVMEVRIEVGSDNVYGICPGCGDGWFLHVQQGQSGAHQQDPQREALSLLAC